VTRLDAPDAGSQPKTTLPPLDTRAPRPRVARLRRSVVTAAVLAAAALVAGALAWAFVAQPELRARAFAARAGEAPSAAVGPVRPSEIVTDGPAHYGELDRLPPPRRLGATPAEADAPEPAPRIPPPTARPSGAAPDPRRQLRDQARASELFFAAVRSASAPPAARDASGPADRDAYNSHALTAPLSPFEVKAGAVIPAVLLTAIDTARTGPVVASVSENVFDTVAGRHLLIPQGARLIGRHEGESRYGDDRVFIAWSRLILPNGKSLRLEAPPGVDAQGAVGVPGKVDRRLGDLAIATVFAGAITTLGQAARDRDDRAGSFWGDAGDAAALEAARVGGRLIDRELTVRPSIRLRPGERVRVLVTHDLLLEPYGP
jgi:type IV secretion system protein VirB10